MREGSYRRVSIAELLSGAQASAKSLFWNILRISAWGSIFCEDDAHTGDGKCL